MSTRMGEELPGALIRKYWAERFPPSMAVAVPLLLGVAGQVGGSRSLYTFPADVLLAFLLFAQLRILDDLADRQRDVRIHPERVLVRTTSVRPIAAAALALGTATIAFLLIREASPVGPTLRSGDTHAIGSYLLLIGFLSAWYAERRGRTLLGDHLLLAKYPVLVWIIATSRIETTASSAQLALSMLATYLAACVYEALHDDTSPAAARPALVAGEGLLLAVTLTALSLRGHA
jgi:4-hydroxybenzoate polyprenyltransferase